MCVCVTIYMLNYWGHMFHGTSESWVLLITSTCCHLTHPTGFSALCNVNTMVDRPQDFANLTSSVQSTILIL